GTTTGGSTGGTGDGTGSTTTSGQPAPSIGDAGHGTPVADVIAQFVPQATILPITIFAPFIVAGSSTTTGTGSTTGTTSSVTASTNALTNSQFLYQKLSYLAAHPFVNDPVRPSQVNHVIAAEIRFGSTTTFDSEMSAYRQFPQV